LGQLDPPVPIVAHWDFFPTTRIVVTFNHALQPGAIDHTNWAANFGFTAYSGSAASALGSTVTCNMQNIGVGVPSNFCSYSPPPFDVKTPHGTPAAAFSGFPIT